MKINTALILCAGYGKRLNPITLKIPKPLIKINNEELLYRTIKLVLSFGIKHIKINSFYLSDQIKNFVSSLPYKNNIEVINDGDEILDTGGGVKNMIYSDIQENFVVFNPDTVWSKDYKKIIMDMIIYYEKNNLKNLLMVVNKKKSFDNRFKGDFQLKDNIISRGDINNYIYTGFQILNKNIFKNINERKFSMNKIWHNLIETSELFGFESNQEFVHLTDMSVYKKLSKNN